MAADAFKVLGDEQQVRAVGNVAAGVLLPACHQVSTQRRIRRAVSRHKNAPRSALTRLLRYESLVAAPRMALRALYGFIGEPRFEHDFEHVAYRAETFDARLGPPGFHTVKARVAPPCRASVLPPELFNRCVGESF